MYMHIENKKTQKNGFRCTGGMGQSFADMSATNSCFFIDAFPENPTVPPYY